MLAGPQWRIRASEGKSERGVSIIVKLQQSRVPGRCIEADECGWGKGGEARTRARVHVARRASGEDQLRGHNHGNNSHTTELCGLKQSTTQWYSVVTSNIEMRASNMKRRPTLEPRNTTLKFNRAHLLPLAGRGDVIPTSAHTRGGQRGGNRARVLGERCTFRCAEPLAGGGRGCGRLCRGFRGWAGGRERACECVRVRER